MRIATEQSGRDRGNLFHRLTIEFASELSQTRSDFVRFSNLHPDFVKQCFAAIDADKSPQPNVGEVFPHIFLNCLTLDDRDRRNLAAAWFAMFGYTLLVDHELDKKGYLDGPASIAASALLSWGITTAGRYVADTPYADAFLDNVNRAFAGQYEDIRMRGKANADRRGSDVEKNRAFVATMAAFCAAAREPDDRLVRFVECMLAPLQILDDLEDIDEDFREDNITELVRIVRESVSATTAADRIELYRALMKDPRAQTILQRAPDGIEKAILLLDPHRDQALIAIFAELHQCNGALIAALDDYQRDPSPIKEPEVLRRIEQVASRCG
jgi:hypothetical protein